ncbi:uncharacterized protein PHACADRAFT_190937 [Phanerochaete carnosa HHB-10118-sp]|uniref:Uncharacterized protein n=1 Tax=Phanerochaete carnosa (strain HHB-10118-sp) TaxID=650164 RepID=K5WR64_PHACS|nr:uncharacterized protein PHACADRAFT_190937 [Phanerochaete carnosa HHB-10118-sp]EKM61749.1 hypothetical protein PHACADRAFT_190937 [Phanerochaete carnosa HHB-10118-sp]
MWVPELVGFRCPSPQVPPPSPPKPIFPPVIELPCQQNTHSPSLRFLYNAAAAAAASEAGPFLHPLLLHVHTPCEECFALLAMSRLYLFRLSLLVLTPALQLCRPLPWVYPPFEDLLPARLCSEGQLLPQTHGLSSSNVKLAPRVDHFAAMRLTCYLCQECVPDLAPAPYVSAYQLDGPCGAQ